MIDLKALTSPAMKASSLDSFIIGLRKSINAMYEQAGDTLKEKQKFFEALTASNARADYSIRQKRIIELCAWPLFDKPSMAQEGPGLPEVLWIFCVPFVVTFEKGDNLESLVLQPSPEAMRALMTALSNSGLVSRKGDLSTFQGLFTREDLHAYGPKNVAQLFLGAERGQNANFTPLPLRFDKEIESNRQATLFLICANKLPLGETQYFEETQPWLSKEAHVAITQAIEESGVKVAFVEAYTPTSPGEALLKCNRVGVREMEALLDVAVQEYQTRCVVVRHPMEGVAELYSCLGEDEELMLAPPFYIIEPACIFDKAVEKACEQKGLLFKGAFSAAIPISAMLH